MECLGCGSSVGAPLCCEEGWVRLNHPTLSREARLSVGFRFFLNRVRMDVGYGRDARATDRFVPLTGGLKSPRLRR